MRVLQGAVLTATAALALAGCTSSSGPAPSPSTTSAATPTSATPTASPSGTASPGATASPPSTTTVFVFLGNTIVNRDADCALSYPVPRSVPAPADPVGLTAAAVEELLAGPTPAEQANGYTSWFSQATADDLISVRLVGATAYVNLENHSQDIPNASTSCGSAQYLSQLDNTVRTASGASRVLYAFDGDPEAFWNWLQIGCSAANDDCDPTPFAGP